MCFCLIEFWQWLRIVKVVFKIPLESATATVARINGLGPIEDLGAQLFEVFRGWSVILHRIDYCPPFPLFQAYVLIRVLQDLLTMFNHELQHIFARHILYCFTEDPFDYNPETGETPREFASSHCASRGNLMPDSCQDRENRRVDGDGFVIFVGFSWNYEFQTLQDPRLVCCEGIKADLIACQIFQYSTG